MTPPAATLDALPLAASPAAARRPWPLLPECGLAALGLAAYGLFPSDLGLLTNICAMALFALSLNLVLGQAGIASIGHAALYGAGAYAAGLFAMHVSPEPLLGLAVGGLAGAAVALASGAVLLRSKGLTLVMLTIATSQILLEFANWARDITGGDDGLTGFSVAPLLGRFEFDFAGRTGYLYTLAVLVVAFLGLRKLVDSPFGLTARAIRLDAGRVEALGGRVYPHLLAVYAIGGLVAGLAGALTAQTTKVASLSMLDFQLSAGVLIMVVLGGTSRLAGAIMGTIAYMVIQHVASGLSPHHWLLVLGVLLVATMMALPGGLIQLVDMLRAGITAWWRRRGNGGSTP
ncbi:branched-chain amino acid ABC transporter permease [Variovorax ginsengisoli]|jgi:branched-chain amino acid transport system permease protein|uniref:Branched-chain amino acid ABC transporter permease n=1 Tax=Variovorax ginsengisoli TaxID=363844 RepID=A0ABT8S0W0_9BURK|nr:branched-chain amino acid ABC transporter permease [Variovorax ginsengisoli]MDN8613391.1 branched-chain amino acid ABC transporter permease [Variovorax ginsengisoli]MDO1532561.1 branched-chain amino acid ABC transporter permease [Variovorax ginsengisoli]